MMIRAIRALGHPNTWMRDVLLQRLVKNATILFGGNLIVSFLGLVSLSLTARTLGAEGFGILVMITTYVLIVDRLVNFQSWQAIIKYGSDALEQKHSDDFKALIRFGFLLDAVTAILGAVSAALAAWFVGRWRGWNSQYVLMASLYSITILFHIAGTPIAILRLFDKFKSISVQNAVGAGIKVVGIAIAFWLEAGIWGFMAVWAVVDIAGKIILIALSLREMKRQGLGGFWRGGAGRGIASRFKGVWGFVWTTNINSSIRMASREADVMIIGAALGPAMVGLFKIAKQFSGIVLQLIDPLYQAVFPELAKLYARREIRLFIRFGVRSSILAGIFAVGVWVVFLFFGEWIIEMTAGSAFQEANRVLLWYMAAIVIGAAGFPLQPAMLSMGRPYITFWVHIGSTLIYFGALFLLLGRFGIVGAGMAYVAYYFVWVFVMLVIEANLLRHSLAQA